MTKAGPKGGGDQSDTAYINELWLAKTLMGGWSGGLSGLEVIYDQYVQRLQGRSDCKKQYTKRLCCSHSICANSTAQTMRKASASTANPSRDPRAHHAQAFYIHLR